MLVPDINVLMVAHVLKLMVLLNVTAQMAFPEIIVKRKVILINNNDKSLLFNKMREFSIKISLFLYITKRRLEQNGRKFVIGPKGSRTCSEGTEIMDEMSCRKACRSLMIPEEEILGNHKCYKDEEGFCYQNGHQHSGASLICRTSKTRKF